MRVQKGVWNSEAGIWGGGGGCIAKGSVKGISWPSFCVTRIFSSLARVHYYIVHFFNNFVLFSLRSCFLFVASLIQYDLFLLLIKNVNFSYDSSHAFHYNVTSFDGFSLGVADLGQRSQGECWVRMIRLFVALIVSSYPTT
jgi:hypothetical protein